MVMSAFFGLSDVTAADGQAVIPAKVIEEHPATRTAIPLRGLDPGGDRSDLSPIRAMVGDARVVALGEPAHGVHQPLTFRNRLFEYLVEELGFTAIAVESAFPESRSLSDYVSGGPGTAEAALAENRTWSSEPLQENLHLIRWMHDYNAGPGRKRPVRFYAIDLSYTGPWGSRPTPAAIKLALAYLRKVDAASARSLESLFEPWWPRLSGDPAVTMTKSEHDALTAATDDLIALLERERVTFLAAAPAAEYECALRASIVARQADRMFRVAPVGPPYDQVPPSAWKMINVRDAAMAENVLWALNQQGQGGRLLVVAHNAHVQSAPATFAPWRALERMPTAMGQHLRASLGKDLLVIGMNESASASELISGPGEPAPRPFLIDLRKNGASQAPATPGAFDGMLVVDALSPARVFRQ